MKIETVGKPKIGMTWDGYATITFTTSRENLLRIEEIKANSVLTIEADKADKSRNQNAYMWALIGELAKEVGISKEDVYREYIKDYGIYDVKEIACEAVEEYKKAWKKQGAGWICEETGESKDGYATVICYKGTSAYSQQQLARMIDAIVRDCKSYNIDT